MEGDIIKKSYIVPLVLSAALLCSCTASEVNGSKKNTGIGSSETAAPADTAAQTAAASEELTSYPNEWVSDPSDYLGEYVKTEMKEWDCGFIEYPVFNEQALYPDDARAANALFGQVLTSFEKNIQNGDELNINNGWGYVESSKYGNVLSVIMIYRYFYSDYDVGMYMKAVNFDLETGRAMTPKEVAEAGFYTETEVEDSLKWYVGNYITNRKKHEALYEYCKNGTIPQSEPDGFSTDWYEEYALSSYRSADDELTDLDENALSSINIPFYPAVHLDDAGVLYAEAKIPDDTAGRTYNKIVAAGRSETEMSLLNHRNYFSMLTRTNMLSPDGAVEAAYTYFNKTDRFDPNIYYNYSIDKTDCIYDEYVPDDKHIVYIVRVYTQDDQNVTLLAVDMLENYMWEKDDAGEWQYIHRSLVDYGDAWDRNALGAICLYPSEYDEFLACPLAEAAVTSGGDFILVGSLYQGTTVSVLRGKQNADGAFESEDILFQAVLNEGEWIKVYCPRITDDDADMAIEFAAGFDKGTFVYTGKNYDIICYAFSDEAVG